MKAPGEGSNNPSKLHLRAASTCATLLAALPPAFTLTLQRWNRAGHFKQPFFVTKAARRRPSLTRMAAVGNRRRLRAARERLRELERRAERDGGGAGGCRTRRAAVGSSQDRRLRPGTRPPPQRTGVSAARESCQLF